MLSEYSLKHCWNAIFSRVLIYFSSSMQMYLLRLLVIIWVWRVTIVSQPFNLTIVAQNSKTCCQYCTSLPSFLVFFRQTDGSMADSLKMCDYHLGTIELETGGSNVVRLVYNSVFRTWRILIDLDSFRQSDYIIHCLDRVWYCSEYWLSSVLNCTLKSIQIMSTQHTSSAPWPSDRDGTMKKKDDSIPGEYHELVR